MKLGLAWLTVLGLLVAISCSVNHRSGDYACTKQTDCASPRVCTEGFCTVPDGVPIDGPLGPPTDASSIHDAPTIVDAKIPPPPVDAANTCPSQCTSCDPGAHTCNIECGVTGCSSEVVCPAGYACTIGCNVAGACRNGVVCTDATACKISCGGTNSCRNIMCGDGPCDVTCSGSGSCHGVDCAQSCACDVSCTGTSSGTGLVCQNVICTSLTCDNGPGCSSQFLGCNTCP